MVLYACKKRQPDVPSAPSIRIPATPALVKRGEYLATSVAACMDCHSRRDPNRLAAPIKPGTFGGGGERFGEEVGLPGTFFGKNLTPPALEDWTDGEIYRAITAGIDKDDQPLFPLMPYLHYSTMDERDVYAIVAYLRTLTPIQNEVPPRESKMSPEEMLKAFPHEARPAPRPAETDSVAYGGYLVNVGHCILCHSPMDEKGIIAGKAFSGGLALAVPSGTVYSSNLTPDRETGLGNWTADLFVARFKQFAKENYKSYEVEPGGFNTVMQWTAYGNMTGSDLKAIYAYLRSLKPVSNQVPAFEPKGTQSPPGIPTPAKN
jgi:hypothetical protein